MALFSLEEAYCRVFENVTNVIVCAENIDGVICPVSFDFNLLFSIYSDSGQFYSLFNSLLLSVIYILQCLIMIVILPQSHSHHAQ